MVGNRSVAGRVPGRLLVVAQASLLVFSLLSPAIALGSEPSPDPSPSPTIASDKADDAPGETVTLTGAGWQPGESVHIRVNDDAGETWRYETDVVADEQGSLADSFQLPDWFVATYTVTATGTVSGIATTTFTDSNPQSLSIMPSSVTVTRGNAASYTVHITVGGNNKQCNVSLAITSGLPTGTTPTFSPNPVSTTGTNVSATLSITTTSSTPTGSFLFTVTGTNQEPPGGDCQGPGPGSATSTLVVTAGNQAPVASNVSASTNEDTPVSVQLSATDADGNSVTFSIVGGPSNGTLGPIGTVSCTGTVPKTCTANVTYTPSANFFGSDSFTYKANDSSLDSAPATVSITVNAVNDAPVASNVSASTNEDTPVSVQLSATDADGNSVTFSIVGGPSNGTLGPIGTVSCTGTVPKTCTANVTYTPSANFFGSDSFTYKANDSSLDSAPATVSITVNAVNDAPVVTLSGDALVNEGDTKTYSFTTSDVDSSSFSFASGSPSCGTGGTLVVGSPTIDSSTGAGSFQCTFPDGPASPTVSVTVSDGDGGSDSDSIAVTVANVAPTVILSGPTSANEGATVSYSYTFTDPGADTWTRSVSCGAHGTISNDSFAASTKSGSFDCTWADNFTGEQVSVTVSDDDGGSDSDSIAVTVANVAPQITSASFNASSVSCAANTVTLTVAFTDPGADTWSATIDWGDGTPAQSVASTTSPISTTHTYALAGVYTATVTVADDEGGSDSATASVTVSYTIVGGGFLPPINNTGHGSNPSVFKYGSTIPVKIKVQDCDGSYPSTLGPRIYIQKMSGSVPVNGELEPYSTSAADSGNTMRFTGAPDFQYIYNLASKSFSSDPTSTWQLIVKIPATGQEIKTLIGLKS